MKAILKTITLSIVAALNRAGTRKRYHSYGPRWFRPAKLTVLRLDRMCRVFVSRNEVEKAFRLNAEICFAKGNLYAPLNWRGRVLIAGIQSAYLGETERAANWLAAGVSLQKSPLMARGATFGFPPAFVTWLLQNEQEIETGEGWRRIFAKNASVKDAEKLLVYLAILGTAMGLEQDVLPLLRRVQSPETSSLKKALLLRFPSEIMEEDRLYTADEIFSESKDEAAGKIAANIASRIFSPPGEGKVLILEEERDWLGREKERLPVSDEGLWAACRAIQRLAIGDHKGALKELSISAATHAELIRALDERQGPLKVFIGGFGWTGSSAVFDALRGYPETREMPGAETAPYINHGADSEPMLHQGPAGVMELSLEWVESHSLRPATWKKFIDLYVLTDNHTTYFEYKTVWANRHLRERLGAATYYAIINQLLHDYAVEQAKAGFPRAHTIQNNDRSHLAERTKVFATFGQRIINALFPNDSDIVLFNNSINTNNIMALKFAGSRCHYISVNRSILDQMADQRQSNIFFRIGPVVFAYRKYVKLRQFGKGRKLIEETTDAVFHQTTFENWVGKETVRKGLTEKILGRYDSCAERQFFQPEESRINVGISNRLLSHFEIQFLKIARLLFSGL